MQDPDFTPDEYSYYNRHLTMPEFGISGQKKLKAARVIVIGAGGLGAPVLQYLAGAGIGTIGIVDFDRVEKGNLHRQVLFGMSDLGRMKSKAAGERLQEINPYIGIRTYSERLTIENAQELLSDYDVVVDCTDNFSTRYLVNDTAVMLGIPCVHGSIFRFEGQVSVFNYLNSDGSRGPDYRDLYPETPPPGLVPDCSEAGVLGVLPGIIGSIQANEVIKILSGIGSVLSGRMFLFDVLNFEPRIVSFGKDEREQDAGTPGTVQALTGYDEFCEVCENGTAGNEECSEVPEISVMEYRSLVSRGEEVQLIDVREPFEREVSRIGGKGIPLAEITDHPDAIRCDCKVILYCQSGKRSKEAIRRLQRSHGFDNLYSLQGGMIAWIRESEGSYQRVWE